jgi:7-cyano-7-deazaguanine synthase
MKKAVILVSGGLDSTTCLAIAKSQDFECYALSINYDQRHKAELEAAKAIATHYSVKEHKIITLPMGEFGGSALTDHSIEVPRYKEKEGIPVTYVPARNVIFLSFALAWAEVLNAQDIFIGISSVDYSQYPDCRPEFIETFEKLANLATKIGVEGQSFKINTPLSNLSKAATILEGIRLGVDYGKTVSCYQLSADHKACGYCDSCGLRKKGFLEAGIPDPTNYV